jgi:hypothetical protein
VAVDCGSRCGYSRGGGCGILDLDVLVWRMVDVLVWQMSWFGRCPGLADVLVWQFPSFGRLADGP